MSRIILLLVFIVAACQAATITLHVTQDFVVANNGFSGASIQKPETISFFSNGFSSSVSYFGFDLSQLVLIDAAWITSAQLTFNNFTLLRNEPANIAISYLNPGQIFNENTVTLDTQPTSKGSLGSVSFTANGAIPIEIKTQVLESLARGGLFGMRVDLPGGPISVPSHRSDPNSITIVITYSDETTTTAPSETTTTEVPATTTTSAPSETTTTEIPPVTTTTAAPTTTQAPTSPSTTTTTTQSTTTSTQSPTSGTTTTAAPTPGTTIGGSSTTATPTSAPRPTSTTESPRSSAGKSAATVILCIVPLIIALML